MHPPWPIYFTRANRSRCTCLWIRPSTVPRLMFIQSRGPIAACLLNDYVLKKLFVENSGAPWSSGAWGPGPNGPVVNPPLHMPTAHLNGSLADAIILRRVYLKSLYHRFRWNILINECQVVQMLRIMSSPWTLKVSLSPCIAWCQCKPIL